MGKKLRFTLFFLLLWLIALVSLVFAVQTLSMAGVNTSFIFDLVIGGLAGIIIVAWDISRRQTLLENRYKAFFLFGFSLIMYGYLLKDDFVILALGLCCFIVASQLSIEIVMQRQNYRAD